MFSLQHTLTSSKAKLESLVTIAIRHFSPRVHPHNDGTYKGENPKRWGYEAHHHTRGMLPRLRIKEIKLYTMPTTSKEEPWSKRLATMGQNDFIRILGDDTIEQHELLTHIPDWLRGYRASREYSVLMRKRKEFKYWAHTKPLKWLHMEQRIKFLYRRINNKYQPPGEDKLNKSRHKL